MDSDLDKEKRTIVSTSDDHGLRGFVERLAEHPHQCGARPCRCLDSVESLRDILDNVCDEAKEALKRTPDTSSVRQLTPEESKQVGKAVESFFERTPDAPSATRLLLIRDKQISCAIESLRKIENAINVLFCNEEATVVLHKIERLTDSSSVDREKSE